MDKQEKYQSLGASANKEGLHTALQSSGLNTSEKYFCSVSDADDSHFKFLHCDGAGTKAAVAYLAYKESGDFSHFAGLAQDALVMNLDDAFCLGPVKELSLANLIARNYKNIPDEVLSTLFSSYQTLCKKLSPLGVHFELAGGETADCGDLVRTLLVDAVLSGKIEKSKIISFENIQPGDVIVGLSSTGKASYEDKENSGIGSNGLTLARHALINSSYQNKYPEIRDERTPDSAGQKLLFEKVPNLDLTIAEALLSPTRTFAPILTKLFSTQNVEINGIIHNTGGAHTKISKFAPNVSIQKELPNIPPLFAFIQSQGDISWKEMYKVFNMGVRMEIYTNQDSAKKIVETAASFDVEASIIGSVHTRSDQSVTLDTPNGRFDY